VSQYCTSDNLVSLRLQPQHFKENFTTSYQVGIGSVVIPTAKDSSEKCNKQSSQSRLLMRNARFASPFSSVVSSFFSALRKGFPLQIKRYASSGKRPGSSACQKCLRGRAAPKIKLPIDARPYMCSKLDAGKLKNLPDLVHEVLLAA
jgi:hypothetical protein